MGATKKTLKKFYPESQLIKERSFGDVSQVSENEYNLNQTSEFAPNFGNDMLIT